MRFPVFLFLLAGFAAAVPLTAQTPGPIDVYAGCCGVEAVEFSPGKAYVFVPNVFTPNGDGVNDLFQPFINDEAVEVMDFTIMSARGDTVLFHRATFYYGDVKNYGWDGNRPNGTPYEGLFTYAMRMIGKDLQVRLVEGKACRVVCGPRAAVLHARQSCF